MSQPQQGQGMFPASGWTDGSQFRGSSWVLLSRPLLLSVNLFWASGLTSVVCRRKLYLQGLPHKPHKPTCMRTSMPTGLPTLRDAPASLIRRRRPYTAACKRGHRDDGGADKAGHLLETVFRAGGLL